MHLPVRTIMSQPQAAILRALAPYTSLTEGELRGATRCSGISLQACSTRGWAVRFREHGILAGAVRYTITRLGVSALKEHDKQERRRKRAAVSA